MLFAFKRFNKRTMFSANVLQRVTLNLHRPIPNFYILKFVHKLHFCVTHPLVSKKRRIAESAIYGLIIITLISRVIH